jgi:ADP-ribose pyrophosphatase YjhB (NUDIX family)
MEPILRHAVRMIVLDPAPRILLLRYSLPRAPILWVPPGGGLEPGERHEDAAYRELREELDLKDCALGPWVWVREHVFPLRDQLIRQRERYYLCEVAPFEPPSATRAELAQEGVLELRWWTQEELRTTHGVLFAPRRLRELLEQLLAEGPPSEPIDAGV